MPTRWKQGGPCLAMTALLLANCAPGGGAVDSVDDAFAAPMQSPVGFSPVATCTPLGVYTSPKVGTTFRYRRADGGVSNRRIVSVDGADITYEYHLQGATEPLPPQELSLGFLVIGGTPNRTVTYTVDPAQALRRLEPGQTVTLPTTEISVIKGDRRSLDSPTLVKFDGCGSVSVGGRSEDVRVYRVSRARRLKAPNGVDRIVRTETGYYLSAAHGFPLGYQDDSLTMIEAILVPHQDPRL